ncbi:MAG: hypothetical protein ACYC2R_08500 [Burkholderiales bacterium]
MMAVTYNDIYMRDDLADTGQIPSGAGCSCESPDIIPFGTSPVADPQTEFSGNWTSDVGQNLEYGQINYIYVRGMNAYPGAETGTVQLYYSNSSLLLNVTQWVGNVIQTAESSPLNSVSASAQGDIVVGVDAFQWTPPTPPSGSHYCLVALVGTPNNPVQLPTVDFTSCADFVDWVVDNPSVAQRNITIVSNPVPPTWQQSQQFMNPDSTAEEFYFLIPDISALPMNSTVSLSCAAGEPVPPVNYSATVNGPGPIPVSSPATVIPGNFTGSVVVTVNVPTGGVIPQHCSFNVQFLRAVGDKDEEKLRRHSQSLRALNPAAVKDDSVVVLGNCKIKLQASEGAQNG